MPVKEYTRKSSTVRALEWTGDNYPDLIRFMAGKDAEVPELHGCEIVEMHIPARVVNANIGDFVVEDAFAGTFCSCDPEVFEALHTETTQ